MFGHFERDDLVELAGFGREVTEIGAEDSALGGFDAVLAETFVTERGLLLGEGDYRRVSERKRPTTRVSTMSSGHPCPDEASGSRSTDLR